MAIDITKSARNYAHILFQKKLTSDTANGEDTSKLGLRLYLSGKSCDGFQYGICFDNSVETDKIISIEGLACQLFVDPDSMQFVKNVTIDFVDDERGKGFWIENPEQRQFRGKFFKRKVWRDKFTGQKESGK